MRAFLLCLISLLSQDPKPVNKDKVDVAVAKGAKFLLDEVKRDKLEVGHSQASLSSEEFVLYTLVYADVPQNDPTFQKLLAKILSKEIASTYSASVMALALEALDPRKHQARIFECAQFLIDNQSDNGQWDYGEPPKKPKDGTATGPAVPPPAPETKPGDTTTRISIRRRAKGRPTGDNSNSQYAALGIRACLNAGIEIPNATMSKAQGWWQKAQNKDGGWGYNFGGKPGDSYASMTAGAVGASTIYCFYLGGDKKINSAVTGGMGWLTGQFSIKENAKHSPPDEWVYYWLYAVERVGVLYGTEQIGKHWWYSEGCDFLLPAQQADGSWQHDPPSLGGAVADTCFAILFLRRATKPLKPVATGAERK